VRARVIGRLGWTVVAIIVVETIVCGLAAAPIVAFWWWLAKSTVSAGALARITLFSLAIVPSYMLFALGLMVWSPFATSITRARTRPDMEMRIADLEWPLLAWARYMAAIHLVRVFAGTLFRGSPIWSAYLRLNGARIGRRVYVNTTFISDHNLLNLGDDVVIGADVHISGHTVEAGVVKTASVRLGRGVTIGLGSVIDIDVHIGDNSQVGALSLVPKHSRLESDVVYVGIPVRRMH
jgi:acetyltransferase-like isoleucine patch superfamily enzyme